MPEATPDMAATAYQVSAATLWSVLGASAIVLALAVEQLYVFWGLVRGARDLGGEVGKALHHRDLQAARTTCERSTSPIADVFLAALNKVARAGHSVERAAERERQRFRLWMRRRLWAIGTVGALAPFVGLFGTVVGIIRAFSDIAQSEMGGFAVVAEGVSQALWATAGGILIAILAVILYNYFQARGNEALVEVKLVVDEFLEELEVARGQGLQTEASPPASGTTTPAPTTGTGSLVEV